MSYELSASNEARAELLTTASEIIRVARESTHVLMREGLIRPIL